MKGRSTRRLRLWFVVGSLALALTAALAGTALAATGAANATKPAVKPYTAAQWKALIRRAQAEGSVTLYSVQDPTNLAAVAKRFEELYKIKVTIVRNNDSALLSIINAEQGTGKAVADIWVPSLKRLVLGSTKNGWLVDARGPNFFKSRYDRGKFLVGKGWVTGSAVLGMAWNTAAYSGPVTDVTTFLRPEFRGRIGVPDPRISPSFMDWYLAQQKKYGANIIDRLAGQSPKIYVSTLPMTQAVASGEIIGAPCAAGTAIALKAAGAPIDYKVLPDNWNAPYIGVILKQGPHQNAAQLLANFMVSPEGQELSNKGFGALYRNIPGTFYAQPRSVNVNDFTPAKVQAFNDKWVSLYTK